MYGKYVLHCIMSECTSLVGRLGEKVSSSTLTCVSEDSMLLSNPTVASHCIINVDICSGTKYMYIHTCLSTERVL